jgi:hypothetical protein
MHHRRILFSLLATVTLAAAPAAPAQIILRDQCYAPGDVCRRHDYPDLRADRIDRTDRDRTRVAERVEQAIARAQRQAELRSERAATARARTEERATTRALSQRMEMQMRTRDRVNEAVERARERREQTDFDRRLRTRPFTFRW